MSLLGYILYTVLYGIGVAFSDHTASFSNFPAIRLVDQFDSTVAMHVAISINHVSCVTIEVPYLSDYFLFCCLLSCSDLSVKKC